MFGIGHRADAIVHGQLPPDPPAVPEDEGVSLADADLEQVTFREHAAMTFMDSAVGSIFDEGNQFTYATQEIDWDEVADKCVKAADALIRRLERDEE